MKQFEDLTIEELKKLTKEYREHCEDIVTAEELLIILEREKEILKEHWRSK